MISNIRYNAFGLGAEEGINAIILRRIWIRFQGASMDAYLSYAPIDATPKTDSKTSNMMAFIPSSALRPDEFQQPL
jgi:hypothetical protein